MASNSVPFLPSVPSKFNFLLEPQPEPLWGPERTLVDRAEKTAQRLRSLAGILLRDYFLSDFNTPLPGPWREPLRFRYFAHTLDCPNKISPSDLLDKYDRPMNVRACPHCSGLLRKGESAPNNWHTPLHWDVVTSEVFGGRPISKPTYPAYTRYCVESPRNLPIANFVRKGTVELDPDYPERKDAGPYAVGDWDDWTAPELKYWIADQESHPLDQNYFEPARMQGAVRNDFCIFHVRADEANITFKSSRESNNDEISESYITEKDEYGRRLTKPLRVLKIEPENVFALREEEETHAAAYHAFVNDENDASKPVPFRIAPWKLTPMVFENDGEVFRVWWLSIGKAQVTTDTARLREDYELDSMPLAARLVLLPDAVLSPESIREIQAEWDRILKEEYKLPVLRLGTRETRAIPTTRQTTLGRRTQPVTQGRISSVAHDIASGVKINTLVQREIRRDRRRDREAKYASVPEDEIPLLSRYLDVMSPDANPLCKGGCFALLELRHLELKHLAGYNATADEVFDALETERRRSVRNAAKYERKNARKAKLGQEELQKRIDRALTRINLAYGAAAVFRRGHCLEHTTT